MKIYTQTDGVNWLIYEKFFRIAIKSPAIESFFKQWNLRLFKTAKTIKCFCPQFLFYCTQSHEIFIKIKCIENVFHVFWWK
jgi:hypothetical protein